ncbi:MAG TPA: hypothetical protein VMM77_07225 [Gemmatimonadaceae bacterium]|nr:hypothetical protein [Gemmatimonadaceae bacterium]
MSSPLRVALLAAVLAFATWAVGWTGVPLIAFLWGAWRREERRAPFEAGIAGSSAWACLLLFAAIRAPVLAVAERMGGLAGVPGIVIVLVMLAFAFGLAWSAAEVARGLMLLAVRQRTAD